jgi:hypothetical protein
MLIFGIQEMDMSNLLKIFFHSCRFDGTLTRVEVGWLGWRRNEETAYSFGWWLMTDADLF